MVVCGDSGVCVCGGVAHASHARPAGCRCNDGAQKMSAAYDVYKVANEEISGTMCGKLWQIRMKKAQRRFS